MGSSSWLEKLAQFCDCSVEELGALAVVLDDESCWFAGELPNTQVIPLPVKDASRSAAFLSRSAAGAEIPLHVHEARETVFVLRGAYRESTGRHVAEGETAVSEPGTTHGIRIDEDGPCVCAIRMDFSERPKAHSLDRGYRVASGTTGRG